MIAQLRAEALGQYTTRTNLALLGAMDGWVVLVILLHALNLPADKLGRKAAQLMVMGQGQRLGTLFAALFGAMAITVEFRHGTIRPTFLATPRRGRVVAAKVGVSMLVGIAFGLTATAVAIGVEIVALKPRGIGLQLVGGDYTQLLFGSVAGAMLWAAIGVGLGAVMRNQVPVMVGICTWLLFVEGLLFGDIGLSSYGRLLPWALAQAASGLDPQKQLLAPACRYSCLPCMRWPQARRDGRRSAGETSRESPVVPTAVMG